MDLSIVIPAYNEEKNIKPLYEQLSPVLLNLNRTYEVLFVNDGSKDNTQQAIEDLTQNDPHVQLITLRRNFGQTAAMDAGFKAASGEIIISMDADLQNDPHDIPRLLAKLNEGYDVVCGWRKHRQDSFTKHVISRGANLLRKLLLHDKIHDSGCTLKAYRKECFDDLDLFGEMHRFIPALLQWKGYNVTEIPVNHHPRKHGTSKYTLTRVLKGFLDMLIVKFWMQYSTRPIHVFGSLGLALSALGALTAGLSIYFKLFKNQDLTDTFLPFLAIMLVILGIQFLVTGVIADILIKNILPTPPLLLPKK